MSDTEPEQPRRRFQIRSKTLFLTFPQCETPLKVFCERVSEYFSPYLTYGVASREDHEDGNHHLHAAICLNEDDDQQCARTGRACLAASTRGLQRTLQGGGREGLRVRYEGWGVPSTSLHRSSSFRLADSGSESAEEEGEGTDCDRIDPGRWLPGRPGRPRAGLCYDEFKEAARVLRFSLFKSEAKSFCRGSAEEDPCTACAWVLDLLQSAHCLLAECEHSSAEDSQAETAVGEVSPRGGEDLIIDDA